MKKNIFYHSTRGNKEKKLSSEAIVYGIADDGGLFIPTEIPKIKADYNQLKELDYNELAYRIMKEYFTDFSEVELKDCIKKAYNEKYDYCQYFNALWRKVSGISNTRSKVAF